MARRPIPIKIKPKDLTQIGQLLRGGIQQVRVILRALALQQLARGVTAPEAAQNLPLTPKAIRQIAHRYNSNGLERALYEKQRPGPNQLLDDQKISSPEFTAIGPSDIRFIARAVGGRVIRKIACGHL